LRRAGIARHAQPRRPLPAPQLRTAHPKSLLLGTALASTLLFGTVLAPTPAAAQVPCPPSTFPAGTPIYLDETDRIVCDTDVPRANDANNAHPFAIDLKTTTYDGTSISLDNSGRLTATGDLAPGGGINAST
jgi:hypothetical protein